MGQIIEKHKLAVRDVSSCLMQSKLSRATRKKNRRAQTLSSWRATRRSPVRSHQERKRSALRNPLNARAPWAQRPVQVPIQRVKKNDAPTWRQVAILNLRHPKTTATSDLIYARPAGLTSCKHCRTSWQSQSRCVHSLQVRLHEQAQTSKRTG